MSSVEISNKIFCAIDTTNLDFALQLASKLKGLIGGVKLGKEFFAAHGPAGVAQISRIGHRIFLDIKLHDIPNTVAGAIHAVTDLGCFMLTIHASGGPSMIEAAVEARGKSATPKILAVTVLTSLNDHDLEAVGQCNPVRDQVIRLARIAKACGVDGIVSSPQEVSALREAMGSDVDLVVPGIRPNWASADDQKRIMTPLKAVRAGADYLVIGRPITRADDPAEAARLIADEMSADEQ